MIVYRADKRDSQTLKKSNGFHAWLPMNVDAARDAIREFFKESSTIEIMSHLWGADKRFVSTALDEDCMGQGAGKNVYKLNIPNLIDRGITKASLGFNSRKIVPVLTPKLLLNHVSLGQATIIALRQPRGNEVTFFTAIPWSTFVSYRPSGEKVFKGLLAAAQSWKPPVPKSRQWRA